MSDKPIFEIGDHLYCRKRDSFLTVSGIDMKEDVYYYKDKAGREFCESELVDAVDFLSTVMKEREVRINVGFDREDNPKLVTLDRNKAQLSLEMNTGKLIEYFDGVDKTTVIDNFQLPENCWMCPMVGIRMDEEYKATNLRCVLIDGEIGSPERYMDTRREDCPLRQISLKTFN